MFRKHFSDHKLLAHADGELGRLANARIERHLKTCWDCRARLAELDRQTHAVATALRGQAFPGPGRIIDARRRFFEHAAEIEFRAPAVRKSRWQAAAAVGSVMLLLVAIAGYWYRPIPRQDASMGHVLALSRSAEEKVEDRGFAARQVFHVRLKELRPLPRERAARLSVTVERERGDYAWRWEDAGGSLCRALWVRGHGKSAFRLDSAVVPFKPAARAAYPLWRIAWDGGGLQAFEAAFLEWLMARRWQALSLSSEFMELVGEDAVRLTTVRVAGGAAVRLTAIREHAGTRIEAVLEVDARTYRPRLERIRFETPGRALELSLEVERVERVKEALGASLFDPPRGAAASHPAPPAVAPVFPKTLRPPIADLDALEVAVRYALHRTGSCLAEPVQVVRESGLICVRGLVRDAQRKSEIAALIAGLPSQEAVRLEVGTLAESASRVAPAPSEDMDSLVVHSSEPPARLLDLLGRALDPAAENSRAWLLRRLSQISDQAVSAAEWAAAEAWELRRLESAFPAEGVAALRPESRWLLETMIRNHLEGLERRVGESRSVLEPLLPPSAPLDGRSLFDTIALAHGRIHALFAGAGPETDTITALSELSAALSAAQQHVKRAETALAIPAPE